MAEHSEGKSRAAAATRANAVKRRDIVLPLEYGEVNICKGKSASIHGSMSTTDFILSKVFRKDGPPLGSEFDSLPFKSIFSFEGPNKICNVHQENHRTLKKRKGSGLLKQDAIDPEGRGPSVKKHGIGKGLMTLWNSLNPDVQKSFPRPKCLDAISQLSKPRICERKSQPKRLANKANNKKKASVKTKKEKKKTKCGRQFAITEQCGLALIGGTCTREFNLYSNLVDDEELESREIKDATFPLNSVKMKLPFSTQPWASSQKLVKKLFKVFHFLYTCSSALHLLPFTLDEFAEAFYVKDSMLLGQIHMTLLKSLLSFIEIKLSCGECLSHTVQNVMFLGFLHNIQRKEFVVKLWIKGLNSLTWVEIMRQILVAAGFGAREGTLEKQLHNKKIDIMVKYGLSPGTLKFAVFSVLMEHGNEGLNVSELEQILRGDDLNLSSTNEELGSSINFTLASDITLFEKISYSAYRLRVATGTCINEYLQCDSDEPETVDYDGREGYVADHLSPKTNILPLYNEIDESSPGEGWLIGVTDGEYSDLNVEEKLDALLALISILSAQFTIKEPVNSILPFSHSKDFNGSTKETHSKKQSSMPERHTQCKDASTASEFQSLDSSIFASQLDETTSSFLEDSNHEVDSGPHSTQSVFLGFDRRYNKYWLFLGPCYPNDPGHRQIFFESSHDGHWWVIDCKETLCCLLSVLDGRGRREAQLRESLLKRENILCHAMSIFSNDMGREMAECNYLENVIVRENSASPVSDVDNNVCSVNALRISVDSNGSNVYVERKGGREEEWKCSQEFDKWMWSSFYCGLSVVKHGKRPYLDSLMRCESCRDLYWRDEKHCRTCHSTFEVDFDLEEKYTIHIATCRQRNDDCVFPKHKVFPSQLQSLKAAVYAIESVIPKEAMSSSWTKYSHNLWIKRLRRIASIYELFQVLTDFVTAIDLDWLDRSNIMVGSGCIVDEIISCFFKMPRTSSSVALWLVKLDNLIDPYLTSTPPFF